MTESLDRVLEAAESHYRELLTQAGKYAKLNMPTVVREYNRDHLKPLRGAIDEVRAAQSR